MEFHGRQAGSLPPIDRQRAPRRYGVGGCSESFMNPCQKDFGRSRAASNTTAPTAPPSADSASAPVRIEVSTPPAAEQECASVVGGAKNSVVPHAGAAEAEFGAPPTPIAACRAHHARHRNTRPRRVLSRGARIGEQRLGGRRSATFGSLGATFPHGLGRAHRAHIQAVAPHQKRRYQCREACVTR